MARIKTGERRRSACRRCDARVDQGAIISRAGLCLRCAMTARAQLQIEMALRQGPIWERYVAGMRRAYGQDWEPPAPDASPDA